MGTSIVDGTVAEATVRRARGGFTIFSTLRFDLDDGSSRTVKNAAAAQPVAETLAPGNRGRFYLFTSFDIKGVHGARLPDGRSVYGFPGSNKMIFLILGIVNVAWITLMVLTKGGVPLLAAALLVLAIVGYILMGKGEREAKAQFDGDGDYAPPPRPSATPLAGV